MTLSTHPKPDLIRHKPARRAALERPHLSDHESSVRARMDRGIMPKSIEALCDWLAVISSAENPDRLHKRGVWRDYGEHAAGGSALGSLALSDEFRRLLDNDPSELDEDGLFRTPYRAMLSRLRRRLPVPAWHIHRLAGVLASPVGGGWRRLADDLMLDHDVASIYISEALRIAWREYTERGMKLL